MEQRLKNLQKLTGINAKAKVNNQLLRPVSIKTNKTAFLASNKVRKKKYLALKSLFSKDFGEDITLNSAENPQKPVSTVLLSKHNASVDEENMLANPKSHATKFLNFDQHSFSSGGSSSSSSSNSNRGQGESSGTAGSNLNLVNKNFEFEEMLKQQNRIFQKIMETKMKNAKHLQSPGNKSNSSSMKRFLDDHDDDENSLSTEAKTSLANDTHLSNDSTTSIDTPKSYTSSVSSFFGDQKCYLRLNHHDEEIPNSDSDS